MPQQQKQKECDKRRRKPYKHAENGKKIRPTVVEENLNNEITSIK